MDTRACICLFLVAATLSLGSAAKSKIRVRNECVRCSPGAPCLAVQLLCDFVPNCEGGEDEAEEICQHSAFGATYMVAVDDPILIRSSDNKPVRVASTNTWFSLIRFTAPAGSELVFEFTEIFFTDNTKRATRSYIATGVGADPTNESSQNARFSPASSVTPSNTHSYETGSHVAWLLLSHPKGEKVGYLLHVRAVASNGVASLAQDEVDVDDDSCFPCVSDDLGCVEQQWVCDGTPDCNHAEDERDCPCDGFTCSDEKCIPHGFRCDGIIDCADDEENCANDAR